MAPSGGMPPNGSERAELKGPNHWLSPNSPNSSRPSLLREGPTSTTNHENMAPEHSCLYEQKNEDRREKQSSKGRSQNGATCFTFVLVRFQIVVSVCISFCLIVRISNDLSPLVQRKF